VRPYYGPKNLKILPTYAPFKDFNNEDFVIARLHDLVLVPIWMGKTQNDVKDDQNENFKMVMV
jgi:hypothetical protein